MSTSEDLPNKNSSQLTPPAARLIKKIGPVAFFAWFVAALLVVVAVILGIRAALPGGYQQKPKPVSLDFGEVAEEVPLPQITPSVPAREISRSVVYNTSRSDGSSFYVITYEVQAGDSLFKIAEDFGLEPETVLWANDETLGGNVDMIEIGMVLIIPPVDGVYYLWQEGDTLDEVAKEFEVSKEVIVNWPGNSFPDLTNPVVVPGTYVMIPGGVGDFQSWVVPVIASGDSGVSTTVLGPGGCTGNYGVGAGTGSFVWPTPIHSLVGNDYWAGHLGVDLAAGDGLPIYAADSGVVIFSGWANGGYGNMIMIDHGNGYQTLYAHLASVISGCGAHVGKGQTIGIGGNTGNSTGPHLHFEVRYNGGFINPWYVLPPP
jgi:LysM repeat protein